MTPTTFRQNCPFAWQPVTQRFEDLCSGAKFDLNDNSIDQPEFLPHAPATDLIRYRLERREDQLRVILDDKVRPPAAKY